MEENGSQIAGQIARHMRFYVQAHHIMPCKKGKFTMRSKIRSPIHINKKVFFFLKLIVSLGLMAYLLWIVDWQMVISIIARSNKFWIAIGPILLLLSVLAGALRWKLTLADSGVMLSYKYAYIGYLIGIFYNIFLPGAIGGDVIKMGFCVQRTGCKSGIATASVLLERIAGVIILFSFLFGVALFYPETMSFLLTNEMISLLMWAAIGWGGLILAIFVVRQAWIKWGEKVQRTGIRGFIYSGMQTLGNLQIQTIFAILILSAIFQGANIFWMFVLARAVGLKLSLSVFFAIIPIVTITTLLPISLGGLGVRESALVFLLGYYGILTSEAITLSFLIYLNQAAVGLLGGLLQFVQPKSTKISLADISKTSGTNE